MFIDIAFNGTDMAFKNNLSNIMERSKKANVMPLVVGLDIKSSFDALDIAEKYNTFCYFGIHPLHFRYNEQDDIDLKLLFSQLEYNRPEEFNNSVLGIGECGLDYYRADNTEEQIEVFRRHLDLWSRYKLPYFFHCRSAYKDFNMMVDRGIKGVVHSFDGTIQDMETLIENGFYIGVNGCSMKTSSNIDVIRKIPLNRLLLETDSPYCTIRKSYEGSKYTEVLKVRHNEPCYINKIAEVVAKVKEIEIDDLENIVYDNTLNLFPQLANKTSFWEINN